MVNVASHGDRSVCGLTIYVFGQYYDTKPMALIHDLAVATPFQRKGIGRKLMDAVNSNCKEQGFEELFVQADKIDGYATDPYRKTRPTKEEDVSHFYYTTD